MFLCKESLQKQAFEFKGLSCVSPICICSILVLMFCFVLFFNCFNISLTDVNFVEITKSQSQIKSNEILDRLKSKYLKNKIFYLRQTWEYCIDLHHIIIKAIIDNYLLPFRSTQLISCTQPCCSWTHWNVTQYWVMLHMYRITSGGRALNLFWWVCAVRVFLEKLGFLEAKIQTFCVESWNFGQKQDWKCKICLKL